MNTKIREHLHKELIHPGDHITLQSGDARRLQIATLQAAKVAGIPITTKRDGDNIIVTRLPRIKPLDDTVIIV